MSRVIRISEHHAAVSQACTLAMWQARAEAAEREMAAVKQRAWALMEEKDAQLQAARVSSCAFF